MVALGGHATGAFFKERAVIPNQGDNNI
uniref:Uncharacterized protein n=1 Tax=Anguilla anguilla TaxID=7936 RepID=A0A0E9QJM7_ANGAN